MLSGARILSWPAACASHAMVAIAAGLTRTSCVQRSASFETNNNSNGSPTDSSSRAEPRLVSPYTFLSCTPQDVEVLKASPAVRALLEKAAEEKRTVALQELSRVAGVTKLLSSPLHDAMLARIERHARMVTSDGPDGRPLLQGESGEDVSCLFVAPNGGGKSPCLKAAASLLPLVYPRLVTVYCDMKKAAYGRNFHDPLFIERLLVSALVRSGVDTPRSTEALLRSEWPCPRDKPVIGRVGFEEVEADLKAADKRLLVMLDEYEHVFNWFDRELKTRRSIVNAIAQLVNSDSGRITIELCGLSTHLHSLITTQARKPKKVAEMYPVVKVPSSANGNKLPIIRLPSALPNDIDAVKNMLRMWMEENSLLSLSGRAEVSDIIMVKMQSEEGLEEIASLCLFRAGSAATDVRRAVMELHLSSVHQETPVVHVAVYYQMMNVLVKKNADMLSMVKGEINFLLGLSGCTAERERRKSRQTILIA